MAIRDSIDIRTVMKVLRDIFAEALDDIEVEGTNGAAPEVIWANSSKSRPARPFASIRMDVGPTLDAARNDEQRTRLAVTDVDYEVLVATVGQTNALRLNGVRFSHTVLGPDTLTTVATALALLITNSREPVGAAAVGPIISLTPDFPGAIFSIEHRYPPLAGSVTDNTVTPVPVQDHVARQRMTLSVDVFSKVQSAADTGHALYLGQRLRKSLELQRNQLILTDNRIAARVITPLLNVTAPDQGLEDESHVNFGVDVHVTSLLTEPIDVIESVVVETDISGNTDTVTVSSP